MVGREVRVEDDDETLARHVNVRLEVGKPLLKLTAWGFGVQCGIAPEGKAVRLHWQCLPGDVNSAVPATLST